ncbi:hypothetical protein [Vibrio nigripulchritudo]|uniref:hypothetical protein n=1 Tax=Vibrio nigripulchritudo TaxID=28173 RepID=UPI0024906EBF|nr:hypothetical protein [Vibrio nigripulchritudo]BDU37951.1 hypothetical protein TUMSATVNIG2_24200 [Vibrio nigripulchritudo]BDU43673.1 hypothetical protein TUMSATVNIG3_24710 [Vibrio nigripulchritudo]
METTKVYKYKSILRTVIEHRPSGMRQRLAEALGKNRSFISQISNPEYNTPIPFKHLPTIFDVCMFSEEEEMSFLEAYYQAHPNRTSLNKKAKPMIQFAVSFPDLGSEKRNNVIKKAIQDYTKQLISTIEKLD